MTAQDLLDEVQRLAQLEAFAVDDYAATLADEIGPLDEATLDGLEARDARLRAALAAIDGFAGKSMRIRLDNLLALDTAIPPTFRTYLASMVTSYEHDRDTLRERVAAVVARTEPGRAAEAAASVADAAGQVLSMRSRLRERVLGLARDLAARSIPAARQAARDPYAGEEVRLRWVAMRRDLELLVERPERLAAHGLADRLKALPAVEDPPEEAAQPSREELIELD